MIEDALESILVSCIGCGNGISKRSLNLLSETIKNLCDVDPNLVISTIITTLCNYNSKVSPTRILQSISSDLENIDNGYFEKLINHVINNGQDTQLSSIVATIHNFVFVLPGKALIASKANEIGLQIIELFHQTQNTGMYQDIAATMAQFTKKWAYILENKESLVMSLFSELAPSTQTLTELSLLCQSTVNLLNAVIKDSSNLKEIAEDAPRMKPTKLDSCIPVSMSFFEYVKQTLPISSQYQLLASFLLSIKSENYIEISKYLYLLNDCLVSPNITDDFTRSCYLSMLNAILTISSKDIERELLDKCFHALIVTSHSVDVYVRRAVRQCCSTFISNVKKFKSKEYFIELFKTIDQLPSTSIVRAELLPSVIPNVPFELIELDFFNSILSTNFTSGFGLKCITEIYRLNVTQDYTELMLEKLSKYPQDVISTFLRSLLKSVPNALSLLKNHVENSMLLNDAQRITYALNLASIEFMTTNHHTVSLQTLRNALHAWNFSVRESALKLLSSTPGAFSKNYLQTLSEAIPCVFAYCDQKYERILKNYLEIICNKLKQCPMENATIFLRPLIKTFAPLLLPNQSGVKKFYVIDCLRIVWHHFPKYMFTDAIHESLVECLFESSNSLRDLVFQILLDLKKSGIQLKGDYTLRIESRKNSPRFRESDGASRLAVLQTKNVIPLFERVWIEFVNSTDPINSSFPLSVVLHIIQSTHDFPLEIIEKILAKLCKFVHNSIDLLNQDVEGRSWISIRQTMAIINTAIKKYGMLLKYTLYQEVGDCIFNFLQKSRHFSANFHAHHVFQTICTRCYLKNDFNKLPMKWADLLLESEKNDSFVQTALALIHSEPSHLFGSQRTIYHSFLTYSSKHTATIPSLQLISAIAADRQTQSNIEPYLNNLLDIVIQLFNQNLGFNERNAAMKCLSQLMARTVQRPDILMNNFINGDYSFILDSLSQDNNDVSFLMLQVIQTIPPSPNMTLCETISVLRSSNNIRLRKCAANTLVLFLPPESAKAFLISALENFDSADSNTTSGIVEQFRAILEQFPSVDIRQEVVEKAKEVFKRKSAVKTTAIILICSFCHSLDICQSKLTYYIQNFKQTITMPYGFDVLRVSFNIMNDKQLIHWLFDNNRTRQLMVLKYLEERKIASQSIINSVLQIALNVSDHTITDLAFSFLITNKDSLEPSRSQYQAFIKKISTEKDEETLVNLIKIASKFKDKVLEILEVLYYYTQFNDLSSSGVLEAISGLLVDCSDELFNKEFNPEVTIQWRFLIRCISDEGRNIRFNASQAISPYITVDRPENMTLCGFRVITETYRLMMRGSPKVLEDLLEYFKGLTVDEGESHFKIEPIPFTYPPSFHISLLTHILKQNKV